MSDRRIRGLLWIMAAVMAASLGLFLLEEPVERGASLPGGKANLARRLAGSPTDWRAASAISEQALDDDWPGRIQAWRAAAELAVHLAPHEDAAHAGFLRAGLFHWYELGESDRRAVLTAVEPTLHNPYTFHRLALPLFELNGDLAFLRRAQPHTSDTIERLSAIAVMNGRFDDYRQLRGELVTVRTRDLIDRLGTLSPSQIIGALPLHPTTDDQPMLVAALGALQRQPLEVDGGRWDILDSLIDFAVRHKLPLSGLRSTISEKTWASPFQRGELARALGESRIAEEIDPHGVRPPAGEIGAINGATFSGFCGAFVCRGIAGDVDGPLSVTIESAGGDEVPPYVECYVDDARVWEGAITAKTTITFVPAGRHRAEITLVNRQTRNQGQRRIRVS